MVLGIWISSTPRLAKSGYQDIFTQKENRGWYVLRGVWGMAPPRI